MATFDKLPSGRWRAQVRRKGQHASRTFRLTSEAEILRADVDLAGPLAVVRNRKSGNHQKIPLIDLTNMMIDHVFEP